MPNIYEPNEPDYVAWLQKQASKGKRQADFMRNQPAFGPWVPTTLINGFTAPPAPYRQVQYRWDYKKDDLDWRGHITIGAGVSGTVAFVLIQPFWPDYDDSFVTDIFDGVDHSTVRVGISSTNGNVTLVWPAA